MAILKDQIFIKASQELTFDVCFHIMRGMQEGELIENSISEAEVQKMLEHGRRQVVRKYEKPNSFIIEDPVASTEIKLSSKDDGTLLYYTFNSKPQNMLIKFIHKIAKGNNEKSVKNFLMMLKETTESYA